MTTCLIKGCLAGLCLLPSVVFAQGEHEFDLQFNPDMARRHAREAAFQADAQRIGGGGVLTLPFFDDFSRFSLPTDDPSIPPEWQHWSDTSAYINTGFPIDPPTIGVATLDGLQRNGYPWDWSAPDTFGEADTLTSLPIDLSGLSAGSNVYLSFWYQSGGRGNNAESEDALTVDFFIDSGEGAWTEAWSTEGVISSDFQAVYLNLADTDFGDAIFQDGFRFRFRNKGNLSGAFDHWHIDYVQVRANVDPENDPIEDLAFMYPGVTLLQNYSAMPWDHFKEDPEFFMDPDTTNTWQRNLGPTVNFASGYRVDGPDQNWDFPNPFSNTFGNGESIIRTELSVQGATDQSPDNNFTFATSLPEEADTCAVFDVTYYHDNTDQRPQNDEATFQQVFYNYYAYDDGTAERSYALNVSGGKVALRYNVVKEDELLGLFIHWIPYGDQIQNENFLLRAWGNNSGVPGSELGTNFTFYTPDYDADGPNGMAYYAYDNPIPVSPGSLYVGFIQDTDEFMHIGNDKSGLNKNTEQLYYQLGIGTEWQQSTITGSLMIRPVFASGKSTVWNSVEESVEPTGTRIYPNPALDVLNIATEQPAKAFELVVHNATGQPVLKKTALRGNQRLPVADLAPGIYLLTLRDASGQAFATHRFIKE